MQQLQGAVPHSWPQEQHRSHGGWLHAGGQPGGGAMPAAGSALTAFVMAWRSWKDAHCWLSSHSWTLNKACLPRPAMLWQNIEKQWPPPTKFPVALGGGLSWELEPGQVLWFLWDYPTGTDWPSIVGDGLQGHFLQHKNDTEPILTDLWTLSFLFPGQA